MYSFPLFELVHCSMFGSNCICFWALFCFIDPMPMFVSTPFHFSFCNFGLFYEIWEGYVSCFAHFSLNCLATLHLLWVYVNFWIIWSSFVKNVMDILTGITLNLSCSSQVSLYSCPRDTLGLFWRCLLFSSLLLCRCGFFPFFKILCSFSWLLKSTVICILRFGSM